MNLISPENAPSHSPHTAVPANAEIEGLAWPTTPSGSSLRRTSPQDHRLVLVPRTQVYLFRPSYDRAKRAFDIIVCLFAMPLALLIMAVCAILIRLDTPGRVVFAQERTGKGGRRFRMYKFRTMVSNAEDLKSQLLHLNKLGWPDFKIEEDPRVTRIGRILRKTSLDELPQLFNVLKGDMSLVGPRPTSFPLDTYDLSHTERLEVPPGITGLWQVSGRGDLDFSERVRLDIEYIERRSIWLDICILVRTARALITRRGAY